MTSKHPKGNFVHFVEADAYPPADDDGDEVWWMSHFICDCGWESHDSQTSLPDDGLALARQHVAETGHPFAGEAVAG